MNIKDALKALAETITGKTANGNTVVQIVTSLAENYEAPVIPATITAIELITDAEGVLTGGTATLSDESAINITLTTTT